jgi:hypothetical protein
MTDGAGALRVVSLAERPDLRMLLGAWTCSWST